MIGEFPAYITFHFLILFAFSPIEIDEVVCIRVAETSSQWSGVMRFGLTNVDPASFRDIELPK